MATPSPRHAAHLLMLFPLVLAEPARSEEQAAADSISYPADYFTAFNPQTALDIVRRAPGFTLQVSADELRGFGGNAGNVLIDGKRPTVKSGGIEEVLNRIPASRVERVEILRAANLAEAQGQALVANIVLVPGGAASTNLTFKLRHAPGDDVITPEIDVSHSRAIGGWDFTAGLTAVHDRDPSIGRYELYDAGGAMIASARESFFGKAKSVTVTAAASGLAAGGTLSFNGRFEHENWTGRQERVALSGAALSSDQGLRERDEDWEIGADWQHGLGRDWTIKLLGLGRKARADFGETFREDAFDAEWSQRIDTSELVGRATLSGKPGGKLSLETGFEVAWNDLSSTFDYFEAGLPVPDASSTADVSELRGEAFANGTFHASPALTFEGGLAFEASKIEVVGGEARSLSFLKPSAAVVWNAGPKTQFRLAAARTVGQLDFEAFAASGDLQNDRPIAGNIDLRPETTDALSLTIDHRFGEGALSLTAARETIGDALAYVPLEQGGQAMVNVGDVAQWRLSGVATLPLTAILPNAELKAEGSAIWARRDDPITGERRNDSRQFRQAEISFRHDIPGLNLAYGVSAEFFSFMHQWYVAETERDREGASLTAFVEKTIGGVKANLTVWSVLGERDDTYRTFYAPDRSGPITGWEYRRSHHGAYVVLTVSKQF